jgi:hypothetical protein
MTFRNHLWLFCITFQLLAISFAFATVTQVADPVLRVAQGSSNSNTTITLTDATSGTAIYYTTNGTNCATYQLMGPRPV